MLLIADSMQSWMKRRKGCLSPKRGGRSWELRAFAGCLPGSNCCSGVWWRPAFVCRCLPGANVTHFCKCFQSLLSGRTCPQKCGFPPLWLMPYHVMGGSSFSCCYLVLRPVRSSCLEALCWRVESTRKTIKCLPASPL